MSPWKIRQGYRCPSCVERVASVRGQHYTDIVKSRGGVPIGPSQIQCRDRHIFDLSLLKLEQGDWCPQCASTPKNRSTNSNISKNPKSFETPTLPITAMSSQEEPDALLAVILCARYEEVRQTRKVFEHNGIKIDEKARDGKLYHSATMYDAEHHAIRIEFHSIEQMGSLAAATSALQIIMARKPYWLLMTGVCAGHPGKTQLGDLVIAQRTLDIRAGKAGTAEFLHGGSRYEINSNLNNFIESLREGLESHDLWKILVPEQRPVTQRYKTHQILKILYEHRSHCQDMERRHSSWIHYILSFLIRANASRFGMSGPEVLMSLRETGVLCDEEECSNLLKKLSIRSQSGATVQVSNENHINKYYLDDQRYVEIGRLLNNNPEFIRLDPKSPSVIRGTLGTDLSTVRADLNREKWLALAKEVADRDLVALEMEAHGLYHATNVINNSDHQQDRPIVQTILVKGVSDLADPDKDDQFQTYSKQVSAAFVYRFLRDYGYKAARKLGLRNLTSANFDVELKKKVHTDSKADRYEAKKQTNLTSMVTPFKAKRLDELKTRIQLLQQPGPGVIICAITGIAGCGKSELAKAHAWQFCTKPNNFVWRLDPDPDTTNNTASTVSYQKAYAQLLDNFNLQSLKPSTLRNAGNVSSASKYFTLEQDQPIRLLDPDF